MNHHRPDHRQHRERGSISIFIAVLAVAFIGITGLVVDGGAKLDALGTARDLADNAARAGAQEIDTAAYRTTGTIVLDPDAATAAALTHLAATGHSGSVAVDGPTVSVTVAINVNPRILPGRWTVTATESATTLTEPQGA